MNRREAWQEVRRLVGAACNTPDQQVVEAVGAIREMFNSVCDNLQDCCQRHGLGGGGERVDEVVVSEIDRLLGVISREHSPPYKRAADADKAELVCGALNALHRGSETGADPSGDIPSGVERNHEVDSMQGTIASRPIAERFARAAELEQRLALAEEALRDVKKIARDRDRNRGHHECGTVDAVVIQAIENRAIVALASIQRDTQATESEGR